MEAGAVNQHRERLEAMGDESLAAELKQAPVTTSERIALRWALDRIDELAEVARTTLRAVELANKVKPPLLSDDVAAKARVALASLEGDGEVSVTREETDPRAIPPDVRDKLIAIRDALIVNCVDEAYHALYSIADPLFLSFTPWDAMEAKPGEEGGEAI
jgi:hypothetical protein